MPLLKHLGVSTTRIGAVMGEPVPVSILSNSHAFLREAASKAGAAEEDARQWQFAIVHVAQALELSLKALLQEIHPVLVFDNVDKPNRTVGPQAALRRLQDPKIGGLQLSRTEVTKVLRVIDLRNEFVHSAFELRAEHAAAKFFEVFAFVADFQARHLGTEIDQIVPPAEFASLLAAEKGARELAERASRRIEAEGIPEESVWMCPDCGNGTFVAYEGIDSCYTCRFSQEVVACTYCDEWKFGSDLTDFSDSFEWDCGSGGIGRIHDNFGYSESVACNTCLPAILDDIERQRLDDDYYRQMEEDYYLRFGHQPG